VDDHVEELNREWLDWVTTNLGRDSKLASAAAKAAAEAALGGSSFTASTDAARKAWIDAGRRPNLDRLAIWAVALGILSLIFFVLCLGFVLGPMAVTIGFVSLRRVTRSEGSLRGIGTAAAGIVLGIAGLIASIAWWSVIHTPTGAMFCVGPEGNLC
jgi:hypothetical protein